MPKRRRKPTRAASLALLTLAPVLPILAILASCSRPPVEEARGPVKPVGTAPRARPARPVPAIEILPQDRAYFFGVRGAVAARQLTLTSHLDHPLALRGATSDNPLFRAQVTPLTPGRSYRLTVTLDPRAPAGKHEGTLRLATDDPARPVIEIPLRAALDEVVSATPDRVYFGRLRAADLGDGALGRRQVLVERHGGSGFQVLGATSDLPFLELSVARDKGESWRVSVRIAGARAVKGELHGTVVVRTNDPAFPELRLPVRGTLL